MVPPVYSLVYTPAHAAHLYCCSALLPYAKSARDQSQPVQPKDEDEGASDYDSESEFSPASGSEIDSDSISVASRSSCEASPLHRLARCVCLVHKCATPSGLLMLQYTSVRYGVLVDLCVCRACSGARGSSKPAPSDEEAAKEEEVDEAEELVRGDEEQPPAKTRKLFANTCAFKERRIQKKKEHSKKRRRPK
jgi:hypothetical protein